MAGNQSAAEGDSGGTAEPLRISASLLEDKIYASWLGQNFYLVAPYIVMIAVLLVRPYGLFGSRPAERL